MERVLVRFFGSLFVTLVILDEYDFRAHKVVIKGGSF